MSTRYTGAGLELRFLGGFDVRIDDGQRVRFPFRKAAALFAYVAYSPGRLEAREVLATLLWPDADSKSGRGNLRQALYEIRNALPQSLRNRALAATRTSAGFDANCPRTSDVETFLACSSATGDSADIAALGRASELYRGRFLDGLVLNDCEEFEAWQRREEERLHRAAIAVERSLTAYYRARGEYESALRHAKKLLDLDPYLDSTHAEIMELYHLLGDRSRAVAQYREMVRQLEVELDATPSPEVRRLYKGLRAGAPAVLSGRAPPKAHLGPHPPLVDRQGLLSELHLVSRRVAVGRPVLVLVTGTLGSGKTRLARTFLNQASKRFDPYYHVGAASSPPQLANLRSNVSNPRPLAVFVDELPRRELVEAASAWNDRADRPLLLTATITETASQRDPSTTSEISPFRTLEARLEPLSAEGVREIASSLVMRGDSAQLTDLLLEHGDRNALRIAELIYALSDHDVLHSAGRKRWTLGGDLASLAFDPAAPLEKLIRTRVELLPRSVSRLLSWAAILGEQFDIDQLRAVSGEDERLVDLAIEEMLRRWLIRKSPLRWRSDPPQDSLSAWISGERRGRFEFSHRLVWESVLTRIPKSRRRQLHQQAIEVIAKVTVPTDE